MFCGEVRHHNFIRLDRDLSTCLTPITVARLGKWFPRIKWCTSKNQARRLICTPLNLYYQQACHSNFLLICRVQDQLIYFQLLKGLQNSFIVTSAHISVVAVVFGLHCIYYQELNRNFTTQLFKIYICLKQRVILKQIHLVFVHL